MSGAFSKFFILSLFTVGLSACQTANGSLKDLEVSELSSSGDSSASVRNISKNQFYASNETLALANAQFKEKNYGRSYTLYKKSVEVLPNDPSAWLGLAASSDHLSRFDTSDRAYRVLAKMIPDRIEFHNNLGYSYLLRGDLVKARKHFLKAFEIDPANEFAANNLELLKNSVSFVKRG